MDGIVSSVLHSYDEVKVLGVSVIVPLYVAYNSLAFLWIETKGKELGYKDLVTNFLKRRRVHLLVVVIVSFGV